MDVRRFDDVEAFAAVAGPYLVADEPRHNLELGIIAQLRSDPGVYEGTPYLLAVERDGEVTAVAIRTPPHNLLVSASDPAALEPIAADARQQFASLPGVQSTAPVAERFAEAWSRLSGQEAQPGTRQRIYRLDRAPELPSVPGAMRAAAEEDRPLLVEWIRRFMAEAVPYQDPSRADATVDARMAGSSSSGGFRLWVDGDPVSVAGFAGPTPTGIRVGPVYTPPPLRGRGYATACVAALSRELLEGGRQTCFLFTDLSNPTSNRIYTAIGYRPVCDVAEIRFGGPR